MIPRIPEGVQERLNDEVRAVHKKLTSSESAYNEHEDDKHGMNRTIIFNPAFSQNHETPSLGKGQPSSSVGAGAGFVLSRMVIRLLRAYAVLRLFSEGLSDAYRSINLGRLKIAVFASDPTTKFDSRQFYRVARYPRQRVGHHGNYNESGERVVKVAQWGFRCGQATPS